eukprot:g4545.t1
MTVLQSVLWCLASSAVDFRFGVATVTTVLDADAAGVWRDGAPYPHGIALYELGGKDLALVVSHSDSNVKRVDVATGAAVTVAGCTGGPGCFRALVDGTGTSARFYNPYGLALGGDGTDAMTIVLVADFWNHAIRKLTNCNQPAGCDVTTLAGGCDHGAYGTAPNQCGTARFSSPVDVALSLSSDMALVVDRDNHAIRKIVLSTGQVTTVAGQLGTSGFADGVGMGTDARFRAPRGVAMDPAAGMAIVTDGGNHVLRRLELATPHRVTTLAGTPQSTGTADGRGSAARFFWPWGVAVDPPRGIALVCDNHNRAIRRVVYDYSKAGRATPHSDWDVSTIAGTAGAGWFSTEAGTPSLPPAAGENARFAEPNRAPGGS